MKVKPWQFPMCKGRRWQNLLIWFLLTIALSRAFNAGNKTSESRRKGKALNISKKSCFDPSGRTGVCIFKWECIQQNGTKIGTCMDGFIVGTCCHYSVQVDNALLDSTDILQDININELTPSKYKPYKESFSKPIFPPKLSSIAPVTNEPYSVPSKPGVTTPTSLSVSSTTPPLVTWTSVGATKISNHKRPNQGYSPFAMPHGTWQAGIAYPVSHYRPNIPLQQYRPPFYGSFYGANHYNKAVNKNENPGGNFTIFSSDDKNKHSSSETTTIAVPIAQWMSTKTTGNTILPVANALNRLPVPTTISQVVQPAIAVTAMTTRKPHLYSAWSKNATDSQNLKVNKISTTAAPLKKRPLLDYRKDCGVRALAPRARIVGGMSAYFGKWPWQILVKEAAWLGLYHKNKCGGVLISSKYAITAGHCQPGFLSSLVVILGEYDLTMDIEVLKPEMRRVKRMVVHRHYNPQNFDNDIAILELDPPVIFRPHISPICLPDKDEDFTGKMAYVTGWGKTLHGGAIPNLLQEVQVPIVSNAKCLDMFKVAGHTKVIKDNFLCAGYEAGGKDSCEGDSGGPLMVQRNDSRWVLAGTVSHGIRCADPNLPGVYMRISSYRPWIDKIVGS